MILKRNTAHPNFIVGLLSYLLFLTGIILQAYNSVPGLQLIMVAIILGGLHWVGSIIDVCTDSELKSDEKSRFLWFAVVIMIPPVAGMLYYMMPGKKVAF
jgi:hypothetical protein